MNPPVIVGGIAFLLWLLTRKKPAVVADPPPLKIDTGTTVALENGANAVLKNASASDFIGSAETQGTYVECLDESFEPTSDATCKGILQELPDVSVPITARIRMTEGRTI